MAHVGDLIELLHDVLTYDHDGTTSTLEKGSLGIIISKSLTESGSGMSSSSCDWIQSSVGPIWEIRFNRCTVLCSQREIKVINNI